jgi:ABC-type methionine transport system ATPase subunit
VIRLQQLSKVYGRGADAVTVLDRLDFSVEAGEIFGVVGPSGAGKSTLAQCIALLERPTSGSVIVNGEPLSELSRDRLRVARRRIGTVFQRDGLFSRRTAAENVALPLEYLGVTRAETNARVAELLDRVGLTGRAGHYPHQLSGGQRQRVGIARALALRPSVLLADEATSGLDPESTAAISALLKELRDELRLSIVFITHEMDTVVRLADSVGRLEHGRIVESGRTVDLLRDPESALGALLRPAPASASAPAGEVALRVRYRGDVPGDWLARVARELTVSPTLLGADIATIDGQVVGSATIAVPAGAVTSVSSFLSEFGLDARLFDDARGDEPSASPETDPALEAAA